MKTRQIFILAILIGILGSVTITARVMASQQQNQIHIAREVIRFHVRANSDSREDQQLKMKVKVQVLELLQPLLERSNSVEESREILACHRDDIIKNVQETLAANNSEQRVKVYLVREEFPVKQYGDMVFPAGEYEALRIDLGENNGKNWWCVMYPSLCFVDETHGVVPTKSKKKLKKVLSKKEYQSLNPKIRFKFIEMIRSID